MIPNNTELLTGILAHTKGINNSKLIGDKIGVVSIEIQNRKTHLATFPVFADGLQAKGRDFYSCNEPTGEEQLLSGTFMDQTSMNHTFSSYRVIVSLKTSTYRLCMNDGAQ